MLVCSLATKSRKWLAYDAVYFSATHADLVHDIIYIECQTVNGSTHGHVFATFEQLFLKKLKKLDHKSIEKLW